jgi:hypothetical protein
MGTSGNMMVKWVCLYAQYELILGKRSQGKSGLQDENFRIIYMSRWLK